MSLGTFKIAESVACFLHIKETWQQSFKILVWGYLVVGLITEPLGFVQDARDVLALFDEWLGVLDSAVFVVWTIPLQDDTPVCVMTAWW